MNGARKWEESNEAITEKSAKGGGDIVAMLHNRRTTKWKSSSHNEDTTTTTTRSKVENIVDNDVTMMIGCCHIYDVEQGKLYRNQVEAFPALVYRPSARIYSQLPITRPAVSRYRVMRP